MNKAHLSNENLMNSRFNNLTHLIEVPKTLRFQLRLVKSVSENEIEICKNNDSYFANSLSSRDVARAQAYPIVKEALDEGYRTIIKNSLSSINFDNNLQEYASLLTKHETDPKTLEKIQNTCIKYLHQLIQKNGGLKKIKSEKCISYLQETATLNDEEQKALAIFQNFTSYFIGFHQNRDNIFSTDRISTSLYYRAIIENFPTYINNLKVLEQISHIPDQESAILKQNIHIPSTTKDIVTKNVLQDYLQIEHYKNYILQEGIDTYNTIIGGYVTKNQQKHKGLNELINEYNQLHHTRIPRLSNLKKQILAENNTIPLFATIDNENEMYDRVSTLHTLINSANFQQLTIDLVQALQNCNLDETYITSQGLRKLSYTNNTSDKLLELRDFMQEETKSNGKISRKNIKSINDRLGLNDDNELTQKPKIIPFAILYKAFNNSFNIIEIINHDLRKALTQFDIQNKKLSETLLYLKDNQNNITNTNHVQSIREFMESIQEIMHILTMITPKASVSKDQAVYYYINQLLSLCYSNNDVYNQVRNYITKKPYSTKKIRINFDTPNLGAGWSKSKENDYRTVLFRKDNYYYLGVLVHNQKINFEQYSSEEDNFEKMEYHLFPSPNKMLPKCIFTKEVKNHFAQSDDDYELYNPKTFIKPFKITKTFWDLYQVSAIEGTDIKKFQKDYLKNNPHDEAGYKAALTTAIDGCKEFLSSYNSTARFNKLSSLKDSSEYKDIAEFYRDVAEATYEVTFINIPTTAINDLITSGKILLFQIYNQDFAEGHHGKDNLHTMYFKALFSKENLNANIIRLSGNASIFFRHKSIKETVTHQRDTWIVNKTYGLSVKHTIPDAVIVDINNILQENTDVLNSFNEERLYLTDTIIEKMAHTEQLNNDTKEYISTHQSDDNKIVIRKITHDLVKDARYSKDTYLLHIPIMLNAKCTNAKINDLIDTIIDTNDKQYILGIDRGERNLLYICLIDNQGNIIHQRSLNIINGVDYGQKLSIKATNRNNARKNWTQIENIKELKTGYISVAIHEIMSLVMQYDAIIAMENLNIGFKRGRFKFEKQIYQTFENMLADKLNYIVSKNVDYNEIGGALHGYQLAQSSLNVGNNINRNGIIFYVPAGYTSKIDPVTGFVSLFHFGDITNHDHRRDFLNRMKKIRYDASTDTFAFSFAYEDFKNATITNANKVWEVHTYGERIIREKDNHKWTTKIIDLTDTLKKQFDELSIHYTSNDDIKDIILEHSTAIDACYTAFKMAVQMRNFTSENDPNPQDYIISPVMNKFGQFYDSRNYLSQDNPVLPIDADANGAYNIARKALWILKQRQQAHTAKQRPSTISNNDWFIYTQG